MKELFDCSKVRLLGLWKDKKKRDFLQEQNLFIAYAPLWVFRLRFWKRNIENKVSV
jgi:hypothetical protein